MRRLVEASGYQLRALLARYGRVVEAVPEEALNWQPAGEDTNSIAQLVRHATAALRWHLALTRGEAGTYDRDSSFANGRASRAELVALLEEAGLNLAEELSRLEPLDMDQELPAGDRALPRGVFLIHAIGHAYEHVAQAELTAQLRAHGTLTLPGGR
ncbi:MAG: DUF1572 family protein [Candidatus Dormibacteraeota bacterium]|nr:DUF1572 family protein [Candidatus Dormibacteraeota bacterium]